MGKIGNEIVSMLGDTTVQYSISRKEYENRPGYVDRRQRLVLHCKLFKNKTFEQQNVHVYLLVPLELV